MANEKRLIDANALKSRLNELEASGGNKYYRQGVNDTFHKFMPRILDDAPTVDAVEVVHGRWIYEDDTVMKWTTKAICSACKGVAAHNAELAFDYGIANFEKIHKYCPNCGAKMDGDGNG